MIHGYHTIWGAYGFWLPNDPRGSWSDFIRAWELLRHGPATRSTERRTLSKDEYRDWKTAASTALRYPPVHFSAEQIAAVAGGFGKYLSRNRIDVWACSIMEQHVHVVVARHRYSVEQTVNLLKGAATRELSKAGLHPMACWTLSNGRQPSPWADGEWKVYLDSEQSIENAIRYVEANPEREGLARQHWSFVQPFGGLDNSGWITYG